MPVMTELYHFAKNLVLDCGRQLRARRREYGISIQEKTGHSDIVTDHDLWLQRRLCEEILKRYPDHGIIGEENMCREGTSLWKWIIDPIDGTTNYCQFGKIMPFLSHFFVVNNRSSVLFWMWKMYGFMKLKC